MQPRTLFAIALILSLLFACTQPTADTPNTSTDDFRTLLADHWAASLAEKIYFRNDPDAWRMDGDLSEHTTGARARRHQFNDGILKRLNAIDPAGLDAKDRISYQVFRYERETERDSYEQFDHFCEYNILPYLAIGNALHRQVPQRLFLLPPNP